MTCKKCKEYRIQNIDVAHKLHTADRTIQLLKLKLRFIYSVFGELAEEFANTSVSNDDETVDDTVDDDAINS